MHHEIYLEDFELEQDYQHYLEQIEPPTPEPINLLQPDHVVFEQHGEDDFSASERLMAEFETEWAAEDAAIEAAKKAQSEKEKMSQTSIDMKTAPMEANERFYKQSVMGLGPN